jgi:hypothetical protein
MYNDNEGERALSPKTKKELVKMVLKAKRTYKEDVKKAVTKAEKKMIEAFEKDMQNSQTDKEWADQKKEFGKFLEAAAGKDKPFQFLVDMKKRLDEGTLTENMVAAVRKCMDREKQWAKQKEEKASQPPRTITLKIKPFMMKELGIHSRVITGVVKAESAKAWLIEGHADMLESMSFCCRCGRQLTEPASQVTGMGEICADKAGVPYDAAGVLAMNKKQRAAIRKQFVKTLHNQKFERWIPKSQAEVFEG